MTWDTPSYCKLLSAPTYLQNIGFAATARRPDPKTPCCSNTDRFNADSQQKEQTDAGSQQKEQRQTYANTHLNSLSGQLWK